MSDLRRAAPFLASLLAFALGFAVARVLAPPAPIDRPLASAPPPGLAGEIRAALTEASPTARAAAVAGLLASLGPDALAEVRAGFDGAPLDQGDPELALLAVWWAGFDGPGALAWAQEKQRIAWTPFLLTGIGRAWALHDAEAAAAALSTSWIRDPGLRNAFLSGVVRGWYESGRGGVEAYLARTSENGVPGYAPDMLVRARLHREGIEPTIAWLESLPDEGGGALEFKHDAYRRFAEQAARLDPARAASWAAGIGDHRYANGVWLRIGNEWVRSDGKAAMEWLLTLPASGQADAAIEESFRTWLRQRREEADAWIAGAEPSPRLDPALYVYAVFGLAPDNPLQAIDWARRVGDPKRREDALVRVLMLWWLRSPDEAQAWIDQSQLSDALRQRLDQLEAANRRRAGRNAEQPQRARRALEPP